ncbi:hypothetical protein RRG08_011586 [Elysia crispata]|uniref:Uncharacterized protein n=1 Tax=Elysia crispata TaxID=231223 RepID=A0AAE0XQ59_9GAST|nr:hypothetical protein RRG08_011586 [Elysia crispata]
MTFTGYKRLEIRVARKLLESLMGIVTDNRSAAWSTDRGFCTTQTQMSQTSATSLGNQQARLLTMLAKTRNFGSKR